MLLGRVHALSSYVAQPPSKGPGLPSVRSAAVPPGSPGAAAAAAAAGAGGAASVPGAPGADAAQPPALAHYLVHPLRPLPPDANPIAPDVLFQAINTLPLPALAGAQAELLGGGGAASDSAASTSAAAAGLSSSKGFMGAEALAKLDETALTTFTTDLRARLDRESHRATAMVHEIQRREEEFDWTMRVGEEEEEKDDLFDDDEEDVDMKPAPVPNPREGWSVADYLRLLDTGRPPEQAPAPAAQAATGAAGAAAPASTSPAVAAGLVPGPSA